MSVCCSEVYESAAPSGAVPLRCSISAGRCGAPTTRSPRTAAASFAFEEGTISSRIESSPEMAAETESVPRTEVSVPSSDSSPTNTRPATSSSRSTSNAWSIPTAIGRSKPVPSFRTSAGERFTVMWRAGT
jgi:hypothetical protein